MKRDHTQAKRKEIGHITHRRNEKRSHTSHTGETKRDRTKVKRKEITHRRNEKRSHTGETKRDRTKAKRKEIAQRRNEKRSHTGETKRDHTQAKRKEIAQRWFLSHTGEIGMSINMQRYANEDVRNRVRAAIRPHDDLLSIVKARKLRWYGHVTRATGLANTIIQGTVPGDRRRGRPKKCWHDNIKEWTELPLAKTLRLAEDKDGWRKIIKAFVVSLQPPNG